MFNFLDEFCEITGIPINEVYSNYKIVNIGGKILCVQNYIRILNYNNEAVSLSVKGSVLNIEGENLKISQLSNKELIIKGQIKNTFLNGVNVAKK